VILEAKLEDTTELPLGELTEEWPYLSSIHSTANFGHGLGGGKPRAERLLWKDALRVRPYLGPDFASRQFHRAEVETVEIDGGDDLRDAIVGLSNEARETFPRSARGVAGGDPAALHRRRRAGRMRADLD
jgi:hypothetical protein